MRFRKVMVFLVAFWVIGALSATDASAQFRLRIEDLNTIRTDSDGVQRIDAVVVTDQGLGDMSGGVGNEGILFFSFAGMGANPQQPVVTSVTVSWSHPTGFGVPAGVDAFQSLFLNSINMTTSGAANIRLTLEDTGFGFNAVTGNPDPNGSYNLRSHVYDGAFAGSGTVTMQSFVNTSNVAPDFGADTNPLTTTRVALLNTDGMGTSPAQVFNAGSTIGTGNDVSLDPVVPFTKTGPYSLWTQVVFNVTGASDISFNQDAFVTANGEAPNPDGSTPEPASLMLISSGLFGLVGARRRQILGMLGRG